MSKLIIPINASALAQTGCARKFWYLHQRGLRTIDTKPELTFGTALHRYMELSLLGKDHFQAQDGWRDADGTFRPGAIHCLPDDAKVRSRFAQLCAVSNVARLPHPAIIDGKPAVEKQFNILLEEGELAGRPYEIRLQGTMDLIAYDGDGIVIIDHKSTSGWDAQKVLSTYAAAPQTFFYNWIVRRYPTQIFGVGPVADAAFKGNVTFRINLIQLTSKDTVFKLGPTWYINDYLMAEFEDALQANLIRIRHVIARWKLHGEEPLREGMTNASCKYCDYQQLCLAPDTARASVAEQLYKTEDYNPLSED